MTSQDKSYSVIKEQLEFELELSKLILEMSTFFMNLPLEKIDEGIVSGIQKVCELAQADAIAVAIFSEDKSTVTVSHYWNRPGINRDKLRLNATPVSDLPWLSSKLLANEAIRFQSVDDLPMEAEKERAGITARFIQSGMIVPLSSREGIHGALSIDTIFSERIWHARCVKLLTLLAEMITAALIYKRDHERLLQSQKMEVLGQIAGGISHDFNNTLNPILGYSELLLEQLKQGELPKIEELTQSLNSIMIAGQRAKDLVHQILTFGRRSGNKHIPFEASTVVKESLKMLKAATPANVAVEFNKDSQACIIKGNPVEFYQVVMNLAINGIQAMHAKGGTLTLTLESLERSKCSLPEKFKESRYVHFSVHDTGAGIPSEIQLKIFDPFFTSKTVRHGTGLGLSIVKTIVEAMAGDVRFTTNNRNGTLFEIFLPYCNETAIEEAASEGTLAELSGNGAVLFVDDESAILNVAEAMLTRLGYDFKGYSSVQSAIETFEANPHLFDVVISSLHMPGFSGLELAQKIQTLRKDIPVILTSAYEAGNLKLEKGIAAVILKPFSLSMLGQTLKSVLKRKRN